MKNKIIIPAVGISILAIVGITISNIPNIKDANKPAMASNSSSSQSISRESIIIKEKVSSETAYQQNLKIRFPKLNLNLPNSWTVELTQEEPQQDLEEIIDSFKPEQQASITITKENIGKFVLELDDSKPKLYCAVSYTKDNNVFESNFKKYEKTTLLERTNYTKETEERKVYTLENLIPTESLILKDNPIFEKTKSEFFATLPKASQEKAEIQERYKNNVTYCRQENTGFAVDNEKGEPLSLLSVQYSSLNDEDIAKTIDYDLMKEFVRIIENSEGINIVK
jgi:hypothetical protein